MVYLFDKKIVHYIRFFKLREYACDLLKMREEFCQLRECVSNHNQMSLHIMSRGENNVSAAVVSVQKYNSTEACISGCMLSNCM